MEKQRSFNGEINNSANQGAAQNVTGSKMENIEQKESGYFLLNNN